FCGPRGTGKTSTAKILAKAVNCLQPQDGEPCNKCAPCQRITNGLSLDVLEIDAASNRGIDEIRQLKEKVQLGPVEGKYKVYIIDEVHMLTTEAFNALLKTLEEPPGHVIFILATTEPRKVLSTIISRCQRFDFQALRASTIVRRLEEVARANSVEVEPAALSLIARKAAGGLRDALSLLDQILAGAQGRITADGVAALLGVPRQDILQETVDALLAADSSKVLHLVDQALREGVEPRRFLEDLLDWCRNLLLLSVDPGAGELVGLPEEMLENMRDKAGSLDGARLFAIMEKLRSAGSELRYSTQPRISLEMALLGVILGEGEPTSVRIRELERRVKYLEERLGALEKSGPEDGRAAAAGNSGRASAEAFPFKAPAGVSIGPERRGEGKEPARGQLTEAQQETAAAASLTLEEVLRLWPEVLQAARKKSVHLQAYLKGGRPAALQNGRLTLAFKAAFHKSMLEQPAHKKAVEEILRAVTGESLEVVLVEEASSNSGGEESKIGESKISEDVVRKLVDFFGPDKVEIKD
ncbi:MAG: DNA polymerase III subunit gamma/tau, partial [Moorellaceae bacterium]